MKDIQLITDGEATRKRILDVFDKAMSYGEDDSLIIYFAGHGWMDNAKNGYWIPADAIEGEKADYLSNNQLVGDYFRKYNVKHLLVIVDSCFSGAMLGKGEEIARRENWQIPSGFKKPSRWVITSGDLAPVPDGNTGHSPFAERLLQFLKYSDSAVYGIWDLYAYLRKTLDTGSLYAPLETPKHMPGSEFIFCRIEDGEVAIEDKAVDVREEESTVRREEKVYSRRVPDGFMVEGGERRQQLEVSVGQPVGSIRGEHNRTACRCLGNKDV